VGRARARHREASGPSRTDYRTAIVLHDVEGVSNSDIAEALGIGLLAVKVRVHRSRLFVRKRLSEHLTSA